MVVGLVSGPADDARRVLVVTAAGLTLQTIRQTLEADGYSLLAAGEAGEGLRRLREALPELVIVDSGGLGAEALELVMAVRRLSPVPLLLLLPALESAAITRGLDAGADDCGLATLPPLELLARVRALLRRAALPALPARTRLVIDSELTIDFSRALVLVRGRPVRLRPTEYRLLYQLVGQPGRVLTYDSLLARVWGPEYREEIHYVRLYVGYLRRKLEADPAHPRYILTERGLGYRFIDYRTGRASHHDEAHRSTRAL